jgi:energy-coupling factor transporter ATP-binding protein EcfA2
MTTGGRVPGSSQAIEIERFSFRYAGSESWALKDVDLSVEAGSVVLLTGSSGSGKTTLSLALNGTVPQLLEGEAEGRVQVCGLDAAAHQVSRMADHVGMVFQDPEVQLFTLTVEDEVAMSLECIGMPRAEMRERVDWAMDTCGLEGLSLAAPARLSGGQKQRVAIASVLARDPDVLVLDDPTANLDPEGSRSVYETIKRVSVERGRTIVLIARDLDPVHDLLDRIVVMEHGSIAIDGEPREVLEHGDLLARCGIRAPLATEIAYRMKRASQGRWSWPARVPTSEAELLDALPDVRPVVPVDVHDPAPAASPYGDGDPVVEIEGVTFAYETGKKALDDVDLRIMPGEFVAVTGRNGAGKTTMLHHIIGLLRPTKGTVRISGQHTADATVAELAQRVGLIFQNPNHQLFRDTVKAEVAFGPENLGWGPEEVEAAVARAFALTDIAEFAEVDPELLSMGQKQRVAIASVLALNPSLLLLDEPTTGQDENGLAALMELVERLNAEGVTVMMITHDMEVVLAHSSRMVVLAGGRLIADGPPEVVLCQEDILTAAALEAPPLIGISHRLLNAPRDRANTHTPEELAEAAAAAGIFAGAAA